MISIYFLLYSILSSEFTSGNKSFTLFENHRIAMSYSLFLKDSIYRFRGLQLATWTCTSCKCSRNRTLLPDMWIYNAFDTFANRLIRQRKMRIGGWGVLVDVYSFFTPPPFSPFRLNVRQEILRKRIYRLVNRSRSFVD